MAQNQETTLEAINRFARENKGNSHAAEVLMSFCRGECMHFYKSASQCCDLCGYSKD